MQTTRLECAFAGLYPIAKQMGDAFHDLQLHAPLAAGNGDPQSFPGRIGDQAVREQDAAVVTRRHRHRVLDGNRFAKDVLIAQVAGFRLGSQIQSAKKLFVIQEKRKGVLARRRFTRVARVGIALPAPFGIDPPVKQ